MLKWIVIALIGLVVIVGGLVAYASTRPDEFRVQRTTLVKAPPERIYPLIADLQAWKTWSPYERKDPKMMRTFSGPQAGVGAAYAWDGDKNVGSGRMEITEATPTKVVFRLEFFKPFEATNAATFSLSPAGDGTNVTWSMDGRNKLLNKVVCLFMDMDKMVGTDFEAGLASLKAIAEKPGA